MKNLVFVFGETGAGKSTIIDFICKEYNYAKISIGKLCRKEFG